MKIAILTFYWAQDNYGQLLQAYALQKYLSSYGHNVYLIRYNFETDYTKRPLILRLFKAFNLLKLFCYLKNKRHFALILKEQAENDRHFDDFRKNYFTFSREYRSFSELEQNPPEADAYIVGSDQVWNCLWFNENQISSYFLGFGDEKTKRLSYAASFGLTKLSEEAEKIITPLLKRFDYVSVREKSGVELCLKCGKNAEWVCDPTFLLRAEDYRKLYREQHITERKNAFLLLYMLSNENDFDIQKAYDFAQKKNLEVVYVTGNGVLDRRKKTFASIPEWLYLVDNAEFIITNSFHCGVFSAIFHKKFALVPLTGNAASMNSRFDSLFEILKIDVRFISDGDFSSLEKEYEPFMPAASKTFTDMLNQ